MAKERRYTSLSKKEVTLWSAKEKKDLVYIFFSAIGSTLMHGGKQARHQEASYNKH